MLVGLVAAVIVASEGSAQTAEGYLITHISGGVYRAMNNNHGTVFLVTPDGIILADPINTDFSVWLKQEFDDRFGVPVRYVVYSHYHWDHASGGDVFADTARFVGHVNMLSHLTMPPASTISQSWPMPLNSVPPFMAHFETRQNLCHNSEIADPIKWTRQMATKPSVKLPST